MKNRVNLSRVQKLKFVGHLSYTRQHLKGSIVAREQLGIDPTNDRLLSMWARLHKHPISRSISHMPPMSISIFLRWLLSLIAVHEHCCYRSYLSFSIQETKHNGRRIDVNKLKG